MAEASSLKLQIKRNKPDRIPPVEFNSKLVAKCSLNFSNDQCEVETEEDWTDEIFLQVEDSLKGLPTGVKRVSRWVDNNGFDINDIDVITLRGTLQSIATYPFDDYRDHFSILITKINNTVFMEDQNLEDQGHKRKDRHVWFYTQKNGNILMGGGEKDIITTCEIAGYRCLVAAEAAGCDEDGNLVEVKVHRVIHRPEDRHRFRKGKLLKTYFLSYLVGIESILIGFLNPKGDVVERKRYTLPEIENECKKYWNRDYHMDFLGKVLDWALPQVKEGKVYQMAYYGGNQVSLKEF